MADAEIDPSGIVGDVADAIGHRLAESGISVSDHRRLPAHVPGIGQPRRRFRASGGMRDYVIVAARGKPRTLKIDNGRWQKLWLHHQQRQAYPW
jgi:hypothetical protein